MVIYTHFAFCFNFLLSFVYYYTYNQIYYLQQFSLLIRLYCNNYRPKVKPACIPLFTQDSYHSKLVIESALNRLK